MNDFLIAFSCILDDFLTLWVIILSKSQLSQLVSDVHNLRRGFVFSVVQEDIECFGEILFASLINLFASFAIVRNESWRFLVDEFFVGIGEFLKLSLLHFGKDFAVIGDFDVEGIFWFNEGNGFVHEFLGFGEFLVVVDHGLHGEEFGLDFGVVGFAGFEGIKVALGLFDVNLILFSVFDIKGYVLEAFVDFNDLIVDGFVHLWNFGFHFLDFDEFLAQLFFEVVSGFLNAEKGQMGKVVVFVGCHFSHFAVVFQVLKDLLTGLEVALRVFNLPFFELDLTPLPEFDSFFEQVIIAE